MLTKLFGSGATSRAAPVSGNLYRELSPQGLEDCKIKVFPPAFWPIKREC